MHAGQAEALKLNKPLLVVGTPGRLTELSRMGKLHTHSCPILVLDEVRAAFIALLLNTICITRHACLTHFHFDQALPNSTLEVIAEFPYVQ